MTIGIWSEIRLSLAKYVLELRRVCRDVATIDHQEEDSDISMNGRLVRRHDRETNHLSIVGFVQSISVLRYCGVIFIRAWLLG